MWLYVPNLATSSRSAPEAEGSISASSWQFPALEASVWWRGKPSPSRTWFQRWNKVSFIRLLCGAMPEPSTAAAGVAAWTASLAASRASRTASPAARAAASTSATCGATCGASSSSRGAGSSSSRTLPACSPRGLTKSLEPSGYGETFASLVSRWREDCSRRKRSATRRRVNASLSLVWPRPAARDWKGANGVEHLENGTGRLHLDQLPNFVEHVWYQRLWPRPTASDANGARNRTSGRSNPNSQHHDGVTLNDAILIYSHRSPKTSTDGAPSSQPRRSLNPLFVEWLMGWPPGWTMLASGAASTGFACSATELSRFRRRMRSALWQLASPLPAPPAQVDLFG